MLRSFCLLAGGKKYKAEEVKKSAIFHRSGDCGLGGKIGKCGIDSRDSFGTKVV